MSYKRTQVEDVLLLRWETVTVEDTKRTSQWIREIQETRGTNVCYIAVVPTDSPPPDPTARRALMDGHQEIADLCTSMRLVILGTGMRQALVRSISAGFLLASGLKGKGFDIDATFEEAADAVAEKAKANAQQILSAAIESGILLEAELSSNE